MKKITLLLFTFCFSICGYSQLAIEGFESTSGPDALPGTNWTLSTGNWAVFDNGIGTAQRWGINTTVNDPPIVFQGTNAAYINRETMNIGDISEDFLSTPLVTIPVNGQLHFYTRSFTSGNQGTVYQIRIAPASASQTNPAAYTTIIQQWTETDLTTTFNLYEEKVVNFPAIYHNQQVYVSFVKVHNQQVAGVAGSGDRWLVDNVSINQQCLNPTTLLATVTSESTASLSWANPSGATSWEIEVVAAAATPTGIGTVYNGTLPYLISGLLPNTAYKFYVRAICSTGYRSEWVGPSPIFTTATAPPICGGNFVDEAGPTANYANNSDSTVIICPTIPGEKVTVTFTSFNTEATWDALYVFDGNSITAPQIPSNNGPGNVPGGLAGGYWGTTIPGPFTSSSVDGCLTFRFRSDNFANNPGWISNVTCAPPPVCQRPTALTATNITSDSVSLGWTNVGIGTSWQVLILPCSSPAPTAATTGWIETTSNPYTFTGLNSAICYDLYVRSNCGTTDGVSLWAGPKSFTTLVAPPVCGGNFVDEAGPTANYANDSDSTVTICPSTAGDLVTVTFTSFDTEVNWDALYVFDGNSITASQIPSNNGPGNVPGGLAGGFWGNTIPGPFTSSSPDGCLTFRFRSDGFFNTSGWIANITCAPAPVCQQPTALTATNITSDTVTFGWTNVGAATSWEVLALPCGDPAPNAATTGWTATTTNPFLVTGLNSATCYNLYVRGNCGTDGISAWAGPKTITTQVAPAICGGNFVDPAGPLLDYANSTDNIVTICPTNTGDQVTVTFTAFDTEDNWDALYVFDGNSIAAPQIASANDGGNVPGGLPGGYWGSEIPGPFTSSSVDGCLTFRFVSDDFVTNPGWIANITCNPPPTCPRPTAVAVSAITQTGATVSWTEVGSASSWQVLFLPASAPIPDASTPGWITANAIPFVYNGLNSGTLYKVYVRAFCSDSDISLWSNPLTFATLISNDECDNAIDVPVNADTSCTQFVSGTVLGATASAEPNNCDGNSDDDVWFSFTATSTIHSVTLNNVLGSDTFILHAVYSGNCSLLNQMYCSNSNQSIANNLVVGQTYYIRVYTWTLTPGQNTTFEVCIGTIPPPITTSTTQYTTLQLVEDVFLNSTCASVSNVTSSTGSNFGTTNGIGYFNQNGSGFPFSEGIVLTSGNASSAPGPNTTTLGDGTDAWPGDTDLETIILAATGNPMNSGNATKLEFDFVPLVDTINFNFVFASEEYGTFQCDYSDAFAFLLTNISTGITTNLAVIPNTTTPVSVVTIRDILYNNNCESVNPEYFDAFYGFGGLDPLGSPTNFNGITVPLTATSAVIPGNQYHIKLVIADRLDNSFDSAVFLEGGSLDIGNIELGEDFLQANNTALCNGTNYTITSGLNPTLYTFQWTNGGNIIPNETGPNLTINQPGIYGVNIQYIGTTCTSNDSITIEYYDPIVPGTPNNLIACDNSGFAQFNLSQNNAAVLGTLDSTTYTVSYYATNTDAIGETNALTTLYTNSTANAQMIYVRIENNTTGCFETRTFNLIVTPSVVPSFLSPAPICNGGTAPTLPSTSLNGITGTWSPAVVDNTQTATYTFTPNANQCASTTTLVITVNPLTTPTFTQVLPICSGDLLSPLPTTSIEGVVGTWSPALNNTTTTTYTFTPSNINPTPVNLIVNGDFTTGNSGFVTDYQYITNAGLNGVQRAYGIVSTANSWFQFFPACNSIAPSGGNMMVVDGSTSNGGNDIVWSQTVTVLPNQTYNFSYWLQTISMPNPANAEVTINGVSIGMTTAPITNCQAGQYTYTWNSGANTTAQIAIYDRNVQSNGNDFSLDDISFVQSSIITCPTTTTLTITVNQPIVATFNAIQPLCSGGTAPTLPSTSLEGFTGTWTPSEIDNITSGTYTFVADAGQCASNGSLAVTVQSSFDFEITGSCIDNDYVLEVTAVNNTFDVDNASYNWFTSDQQLVGTNSNTFNVTDYLSSTQATEVLPISFSVTVTTPDGCFRNEIITLDRIFCGIQKGISANNDGSNDFFDLSQLNVRNLTIFNRFGMKVYGKSQYRDEWRGQSDKGDELPDGTYYYIIEFNSGDATKTGWIYINREQ